MARCQHLVFAVIVICGICITFTDAEIHRAKAAAHKTGVKPRRNSDVAFDPNRGDMLAEDATSSHEVWIYSLFGAVLVGLSGIFPLLVIPIESGPALKHGGIGATFLTADSQQHPYSVVFSWIPRMRRSL